MLGERDVLHVACVAVPVVLVLNHGRCVTLLHLHEVLVVSSSSAYRGQGSSSMRPQVRHLLAEVSGIERERFVALLSLVQLHQNASEVEQLARLSCFKLGDED